MGVCGPVLSLRGENRAPAEDEGRPPSAFDVREPGEYSGAGHTWKRYAQVSPKTVSLGTNHGGFLLRDTRQQCALDHLAAALRCGPMRRR